MAISQSAYAADNARVNGAYFAVYIASNILPGVMRRNGDGDNEMRAPCATREPASAARSKRRVGSGFFGDRPIIDMAY